jgi:hypothetical protein
MSLDTAKLEKVRELGGGMVQARCPACAEGGNDRSGEHLRIYPDGKFGCCVHPKNGEHRKRIWALAGCKRHLAPDKSFGLRLKTPPSLPATQSIAAALTGFAVRTPRTPETGLENGGPSLPPHWEIDLRTPRTAKVKLRACARVDVITTNIDKGDVLMKLKDSVSAVRAVRSLQAVTMPVGERLPYLTAGGTLVIPFDSPARYHWWRGGQSVAETRAEVEPANMQHSTPNIKPRGKEIHAITV